ncbi:hypothetical protein D3C78_962300 [compost metagenome]
MHGLFHTGQTLLTGACKGRRLVGGRGDLGHGPHQVAGGGSDFPRGRADFGGGGGGFSRSRLLLLGRRGDLGHRGGDLYRRALGLGHQVGQLTHHFVEAGFHGAELILAVKLHAHAEVATAELVQGMHDTLHRCGDRAHQHQAANTCGNDRQDQ